MRTATKMISFGFKNFKGQNNPEFKHIDLRKDYYKILEVNQDAEVFTIRKSYMNLVKKYHPDRNPNGQTQFTEVQEAYKVLSNTDSKKYYDNHNIFYDPRQSSFRSSQTREDLNQKDREFHDYMRYRASEDFSESQYEREKREDENRRRQQRQEQMSEEAKRKRRLQQEVQFQKSMMFKRNPVWQQANNYYNYQRRKEQRHQRQKQLQKLVNQGAESLEDVLKKWWFKKP